MPLLDGLHHALHDHGGSEVSQHIGLFMQVQHAGHTAMTM